MLISQLIKHLERAKARIGDVQCVMEIPDWRDEGDLILSTVEAVSERKRPAHDDHGRPVLEPVAFVDWRC